MIWSGGKMFDMIKKRWVEYWDWILSLPDGIGAALSFATVLIPIFVLSFGVIGILNSHFKGECLDSQLPRRWSSADKICEEYHDGEWIKADLLGTNIYYYNDAASREH